MILYFSCFSEIEAKEGFQSRKNQTNKYEVAHFATMTSLLNYSTAPYLFYYFEFPEQNQKNWTALWVLGLDTVTKTQFGKAV